jgi:hypothetical protein
MRVSIDHLLLFAMLDIGMLAVRILAVVGGVAVGGYGTGWLIKILAKSLVFKQPPAALLRISRVLGALVVGLIVAAWVFNLGGTRGIGGSGGGWWPFGQSGGAGTTNAGEPEKTPAATPSKTESAAKTLRIHMLGGSQAEKDSRFYQIEDDQPRTWAELEKLLTGRKKNDTSFVIEIVITKTSVDEQSEAVHELKNWAKKNSVAVK